MEGCLHRWELPFPSSGSDSFVVDTTISLFSYSRTMPYTLSAYPWCIDYPILPVIIIKVAPTISTIRGLHLPVPKQIAIAITFIVALSPHVLEALGTAIPIRMDNPALTIVLKR